jgi:hypothetical protein
MTKITRQLLVPDRDLNGFTTAFTLRTIQWEDGIQATAPYTPTGFSGNIPAQPALLASGLAVSPDLGVAQAARQVLNRDVPWRQNQQYTVISTP